MGKVAVAGEAGVSVEKRSGTKSNVRERSFFTADGRIDSLPVVDLHSPTFGDDLLYVFARNVAKARQENKRIIGVEDREPAGSS